MNYADYDWSSDEYQECSADCSDSIITRELMEERDEGDDQIEIGEGEPVFEQNENEE